MAIFLLSAPLTHLPCSDCLGDLKCFQRVGNDLRLPPGCEGSSMSDYDYCYLPETTATEPTQMWGENAVYQVSGFENTPCNGGVFHRASRVNAPANALSAIGQVICVFFDSDSTESWGSALSSAGWFHVGTREGFGYDSDGSNSPVPFVLFCQYGSMSARLPPFPDFGASWGISHGMCSLL